MKTLFPTAVSLTLTLLPCGAADTNSIIGVWQTGQVLSQLGPSVTKYSFTTNGTFTLSTEFTQGLIPTMSRTGTYHLVITDANTLTNRLVTVAQGRTNTASYYFQDSTLVIDYGQRSQVYKLKRKQ